MPLFEVAIISTLSKKEIEEGSTSEKILFGPEFVLAKDDATAGLAAMLGPTAPKDIDLNRAQVLVRPFA
jgi:hypothetical protein